MTSAIMPAMTNKIKNLWLWVILIEGFVSIATEIITMRQLIIVVGSSVVVTSFIIGIFLLALAYGYKRGGAYTTGYIEILQKNFLLASLLLGVGLSSSFILLFFSSIELKLALNSMYVLIAYLVLITAPLVYLLGQTVPITMNMFDNTHSASAVGSKVLHISTIGSFLGAVLTTVLFMNYIGVSWTIVANSLLLASAAIIVANKKFMRLNIIILTIILLGIVYYFNIYINKTSFVASNAYNTYSVMDNITDRSGKTGKILSINSSASSFLAYDNNQGFRYVEQIKKIIFNDLKLRDENILVLGAGGFSISAAGDYGNHFTYIDIDPNLESIVRKNFLAKINGKFIATDARKFLRNNQVKYPLIISDLYGSKTSIPGHLVTKEYFDLVAANLADNGTVIFNIILNPMLQDLYSEKLDNTIRMVFNKCMTMPIEYVNKATNVLYICNNNNYTNAGIYTDDKNSASLDAIKL